MQTTLNAPMGEGVTKGCTHNSLRVEATDLPLALQ